MEAQALDHESKVNQSPTKAEALQHAILATECYMQALESASDVADKTRLRSKCKLLLSRAECIKSSKVWVSKNETAVPLKAPISNRVLSKQEESILLEGSKLHGFVFPPWKSKPSDLAISDFEIASVFTESDDLKLSEAQQQIFDGWKRPCNGEGVDDSASTDEQLMVAFEAMDLVQDVTTDCSVVASLCTITARAQNSHGDLLEAMFHPYDQRRAGPRVSSSRKYILRLNFNGCFREVAVDDRLPSSKTLRSLHVVDRNNPKLLWPALVEKAYLKVRGGYDFPGSNSGTDLWVLTGWIPEQVFLQSDDISHIRIWQRIYKSFNCGDVMITLGTGHMTQKEERHLSLTSEHDYAVLGIKEVDSQKLLLVKNPWSEDTHKQDDTIIQQSLNQTDVTIETVTPLPPGTRWLKFSSVLQNFESFYLNWNPGLFRHRQDHHFTWSIPNQNPPALFSSNPQYSLFSPKGGDVWILLSRHFQTAERSLLIPSEDQTWGWKDHKPHNTTADRSKALGFISIYIISTDTGERIHLSDSALHRGPFVDSPQTLARITLSPGQYYTVVPAQQYLPLAKYSFTFSFFALSPLSVSEAIEKHPFVTLISGSWSTHTSSGSAGSASYHLNPQYSVTIPPSSPTPPTTLTIVISTPNPNLAINTTLVFNSPTPSPSQRPRPIQRVTTLHTNTILSTSGEYRPGCAVATISSLTPGIYTLIPSTFSAGQTGDFQLKICASRPDIVIKPIASEATGRLRMTLPILQLGLGEERYLAPLTVSRVGGVRIVACGVGDSKPLLRIKLERGQGPHKSLLDVSEEGRFSAAPAGVRTGEVDVTPGMCWEGGLWIVVERLGGGGGEIDHVGVEVLSEGVVKVGSWGRGDG